jgi:uncharacterized cupredoxin-like copper-binding protein
MDVARRRGIPVPAAILFATGAAALAGAVALSVVSAAQPTTTVTIDISRSHYSTSSIVVPAGVPVTIVLRNLDPIDHEWIVGDAALHERHRTGTEPVHDTRPTEVTIPAGQTRTTVVTFGSPGDLTFICHLPGHEAYGMIGLVTVVPAG